MQSKKVLVCNHIVTPHAKTPQAGALVILDGKIHDFIPRERIAATSFSDCEVEDLGDLYVCPGMVDLNVRFLEESVSTVTQAAVSGGVTTIVTEDPVDTDGCLYTDVVPVKLLTDENLDSVQDEVAWAFKAYLSKYPAPGKLSKVQEAVNTLADSLLLVHPQLTDSRKPDLREPTEIHIEAVGEALEDIEESESDSDSDSETPNTRSHEEEGAFRRTSLKSKVSIDPFDIGLAVPTSNFLTVGRPAAKDPNVKRGSMQQPVDARKSSILLLKETLKTQSRHSIQCTLNMPDRPVPIQDLPFINNSDNSQESFHLHKLSWPSDWELNAIKHVLAMQPPGRIHFCNLSTNQAGLLVKEAKAQFPHLSAETSVPYLFFNEGNIKPSDTRYKIEPPIREKTNQTLLFDRVKFRDIDCISSYHQPVAPPRKFFGDFKDAASGITTMGFSLQALWTKLKAGLQPHNEQQFLVLLAQWVSQVPAEIMGLHTKGSLAPGKDADLVVWEPFSEFEATHSFNRYSEMSPFVGESLFGRVHKTYLRGQLAYCAESTRSAGTVLSK